MIWKCKLDRKNCLIMFIEFLLFSSLDYKTLFNCDVALGMNKAERLIYGDSLMTHAVSH